MLGPDCPASAELTRPGSISPSLLRRLSAMAVLIAGMAAPAPARAMHLADGILPLGWAAFWTVVAAPFAAVAVFRYQKKTAREPQTKALVSMVAVVVFLLSCMPIPVPVVGTCSHPCGTGLAAILIGPWMTILVTVAALILQALFLAHGGLTTLGADVLSMGIVGAFSGWLVFTLLRRTPASLGLAAFLAGLTADWCTYAMTSLELASALHGSQSFGRIWLTTSVAFLPTQAPVGVLEGVLTAGAVTFMVRRRPDLCLRLGLLQEAEASS